MLLNSQNNLGAVDSGNLKEYLAISSYRNVLDMINTFDTQLASWGNALYNDAIMVFRDGLQFPNDRAARGYAIKKVGIIGKKGAFSPLVLLFKTLAENGLNYSGYKLDNYARVNAKWRRTNYRPKMRGTRPNSARDLLLISRKLNWELNKLRLPVPNNFRQITDKIQDIPTGFIYTEKEYDYDTGSTSTYYRVNSVNYIALLESINVYGQLKLTIKTLRNSVRKEIDAAKLAEKVQEETLRFEAAALISRQAAAALAEQNKIRIIAEKKAVYEKELLSAEQLKIELGTLRVNNAAELNNIKQLQTVATPIERAALRETEYKITGAIKQIKVVEKDTEKRVNTAIKAATVLNNQIRQISNKSSGTVQINRPPLPDLIDRDIIDLKSPQTGKKKTNLAPILTILTVAAGVILS